MFRDLEKAQTVFTGIAAHSDLGANVSYKGRTLDASGMLVSGSYFNVLGVRPALGRLFTPDDDRTPGGHFVVVLSHAYWRSQLDADPGILNQTLIVNGHPMTIVGVAPEGFTGTTLGSDPQVFVPLSMRELMIPRWKGLDNRRSYWAYLFARLKPGVSIEQARSAINVPYRAILNDVEAPLQKGMSDQTMKRFRAKEIVLEPGARGQSSMHTEARAPMLLLLGVTAVVVLIACANIANLLLARATARRHELSVRLALGASRWRLARLLLAESLVLSIAGAALGVLVAIWGSRLLVAQLSTTTNRVFLDLTFDWRIFAFTVGATVATTLLFGTVPALRAAAIAPMEAIKEQGRGAVGDVRGIFANGLVIAQVALSVVLVVGAGLFVRTFASLATLQLGFDRDRVLVVNINSQRAAIPPNERIATYERVHDAARALPGVAGAGVVSARFCACSVWICLCFSSCGLAKKYCQPSSTRPERTTAIIVFF